MAKNAITKLIFASFFQDLAVAMKKLGLNPTETEIQVNSLGSATEFYVCGFSNLDFLRHFLLASLRTGTREKPSSNLQLKN